MSVYRQNNCSRSTSSSSDDTVGAVIGVGGFGVGLVALVVSWIASGSFLTALGTAFCFGILGVVGAVVLMFVFGILASIVVFFAELATGGSGGGGDGATFGGLAFLIICAIIIMIYSHWGFWLSLGAAFGVTLVLGILIAGIASMLKG